MTPPPNDPTLHRWAARLVAGPLSLAMAASILAPGPASAEPPSEPTMSVTATTCSASQSGFSAATGSCQDPASHLSFRVIGTCQHAITGGLYQVTSPLTSTFDTVSVFCDFLRPDRIVDWGTVIVVTGPAPPTVTLFSCNYGGRAMFQCTLVASGWTKIRWTVGGTAMPAWNNKLSVTGFCTATFTSVKAVVSNDVGSVFKSKSVKCDAHRT